MIVEDEAIVALEMKSSLSSIGYETCKIVNSGKKAIDGVEQEKPDIVLMDIIIKGEMDGIEAAREIRSRHDIPIIFTTGCEDEETRKRAEEVKPIAYLIKPVETEDIKLAIEKALEIHE